MTIESDKEISLIRTALGWITSMTYRIERNFIFPKKKQIAVSYNYPLNVLDESSRSIFR